MLSPFCSKARRFVARDPADDAFINILEGSIRSGKTWAMIPKLLVLCSYKVQGKRVILGVSKQTVYNNVLSDLFDFVGTENYDYNRQTGDLSIFGVRWIVIGAKDEGSEKYIRGLTVGIAYVDEATLIPRSSFLMLLSRMSHHAARLYATTNPDTPFHFLKVDYLDSKEMRQSGDVWSEHFTLRDNHSLTPAKVRQYERMYHGVFYQRFILGRWVIAEGSIYRDCWQEDKLLYDQVDEPVGLRGQGGHVRRWITIDYGTVNACVFLDWYDDGKLFYLVNEYYWDSVAQGRQKTDSEYAEDLITFMGRGAAAEIIVDPSAASFKLELSKRGLWVSDAKNEVIDGIRLTSTALGNGLIRINRTACPVTCRQMPNYAWDEKAKQRGEEKPLKQMDHTCDGFRYFCETCIDPWRMAA